LLGHLDVFLTMGGLMREPLPVNLTLV
jgi:hypothetical protein